jgi:hypothetical protein
MKTFFLSLTILMAQILSAQIYTTADEIPSFPGCESITDNAQKCFCNQSQMLIIGETTGQIAQIEMVIDGNGWINSWRVTNITDVDILAKVDFMMSSMRHNIRLTPARINGKPVNYQMVMKLPILFSN